MSAADGTGLDHGQTPADLQAGRGQRGGAPCAVGGMVEQRGTAGDHELRRGVALPQAPERRDDAGRILALLEAADGEDHRAPARPQRSRTAASASVDSLR